MIADLVVILNAILPVSDLIRIKSLKVSV